MAKHVKADTMVPGTEILEVLPVDPLPVPPMPTSCVVEVTPIVLPEYFTAADSATSVAWATAIVEAEDIRVTADGHGPVHA